MDLLTGFALGLGYGIICTFVAVFILTFWKDS